MAVVVDDMMVLPGDGGKVKTVNVICVSWNEKELRYIRKSVRDKKTHVIAKDKILSAAYARGDDGETMQYEGEDGNG